MTNNQQAARELLPCPFCGGDAAFNTVRTSNKSVIRLNGTDTFYGVNCIACGVTTNGFGHGCKTQERAAERWNRRHAREWLPIESAPKDGTEIDVWCPDTDLELPGFRIANVWWCGADRKWRAYGDGRMRWVTQPTHWQPLPAPPRPTQEMETHE